MPSPQGRGINHRGAHTSQQFVLRRVLHSSTLPSTRIYHFRKKRSPITANPGLNRFAPPRSYLAACACLHCCVLEREPLFASAPRRVRASHAHSGAAGRRQLCLLKGKANSCACDSWSCRDIPSPNIRNGLWTRCPEGSI